MAGGDINEYPDAKTAEEQQVEKDQQPVAVGFSLLLAPELEQFLGADPLSFTDQHLVLHDVQIHGFDRRVCLFPTLFGFLEIEKQVRLQNLRDQKNYREDFTDISLVFEQLKFDQLPRFFDLLEGMRRDRQALFLRLELADKQLFSLTLGELRFAGNQPLIEGELQQLPDPSLDLFAELLFDQE